MLEKIYSNENGDIGQANRLPPLFKMPKNVRQIEIILLIKYM